MTAPNTHTFDLCIIGAGIVGLTVAYEFKKKFPHKSIIILEKEHDVAMHASGRNSGVLHAGFYYTPGSLKANFCVEGNRLMKEFCLKQNIPFASTGKVVVAQNQAEIETLIKLHNQAHQNNVKTIIVKERELRDIEKNAKTFKLALYSPDTATVDSKNVCRKLRTLLEQKNVKFYFNTNYFNTSHRYKYLINCAGLHADTIASSFNVGNKYRIAPFKGTYVKYYPDNDSLIKTHIYPVPNSTNPFLGVHFTVTNGDYIKIGPSAIPVLGRENYNGIKGISFRESMTNSMLMLRLYYQNHFNFRELTWKELRLLKKSNLIKESAKLVHGINGKFIDTSSGIRAQLFDIENKSLVNDFIIEHTPNSTHILNAVSPAFTCSFAFAKHISKEVEANINKQRE